MATPSEDELYPYFDQRIYDMIERFPAIINENYPFDVGQTRRNLGENDVMGLVTTLENWATDRAAAAAVGRRVWWGKPNASIFNLGVQLGLFNSGLSYENFIKAINDARIRDLNLHEQRLSEGMFAALGAPEGAPPGVPADRLRGMQEAREEGDRLIAEIERDRAAREAAGAAANAENATRAGEGRMGGGWGAALVQYRRHGNPHGYYSGQSPDEAAHHAHLLAGMAGRGGQGAEQGNAGGRYVPAPPSASDAEAAAALDSLGAALAAGLAPPVPPSSPAAPGGRGDSGSPAKKKGRKKGGRRRRRNTRRRRRSRSRRRRKSRRRKSRRRKSRRRKKRF